MKMKKIILSFLLLALISCNNDDKEIQPIKCEYIIEMKYQNGDVDTITYSTDTSYDEYLDHGDLVFYNGWNRKVVSSYVRAYKVLNIK